MKYTATLQWYKVIIDTDEGTITGNTYEARKIIKQEFEGIKWDGARKAWTMEPAKMAKIVADMTPYFTRVFKLTPMEPEAQPEAVEAKAEPEAVDQPAEAADQLPELRGSAKQVAWAEDIRASFLQQLEAEQAKMVSEHPETASTYEAIRLSVNTIAEAAWWIDHRTVRAAQMALRDVKVVLADGTETTSAEAARQAAAKMEAGKPDDDPDNTPDGNPTTPTNDTPTDPTSPSAPEQGQGGSTNATSTNDAMKEVTTMKQIITRQTLGELRLAGKRDEANAITARLSNAKEVLAQAYVDHYNEPVKVTVNSLIDSLGYDGAVAAVAEAITPIWTGDARISRDVREWADANTDVDEQIACSFCVTTLHPCNLNQIAQVLMNTERPADKPAAAEVLKQIKQGFANAKRDCTNARKAFEAGDGNKAIRLASRAHDVIDDIRAYYDNKLSIDGNEYEDIARDVARLLEDKEEYKYVAIDLIEAVYKAAAEQADNTDANTDAQATVEPGPMDDARAEGEGVNPPCPPCQGGSEDKDCQVGNEDEPTAESMDDATATFEDEPVEDARATVEVSSSTTDESRFVERARKVADDTARCYEDVMEYNAKYAKSGEMLGCDPKSGALPILKDIEAEAREAGASAETLAAIQAELERAMSYDTMDEFNRMNPYLDYSEEEDQAEPMDDARVTGENTPLPPSEEGAMGEGSEEGVQAKSEAEPTVESEAEPTVESEAEPTVEPMVGPMDEPTTDAPVTFEDEPVADARETFEDGVLPNVDEAIVQLQRVLQRRLDEADGVAVGNARFPIMAGWVAREIETMTEGLSGLTPDTVEELTAMVSLLIELSDALGIGNVDVLLGECENGGGPIPDALVLPVTHADEYNITLLAGRYPEAMKTNGVLYTVKWGELVKAVKRAEDVRNGKAEARKLKAEAKRERFDARVADGRLPMVGEVLHGRSCTIQADGNTMRIVISFRKKPTRKATEACKAAKFRYDAGGQVWVRSLKVKAWREAMNLMATLDAAA